MDYYFLNTLMQEFIIKVVSWVNLKIRVHLKVIQKVFTLTYVKMQGIKVKEDTL